MQPITGETTVGQKTYQQNVLIMLSIDENGGLKDQISASNQQNWLVVWNNCYFSIYLEESSQLTNFFQRGGSTTNQEMERFTSGQEGLIHHDPTKIRDFWMT